MSFKNIVKRIFINTNYALFKTFNLFKLNKPDESSKKRALIINLGFIGDILAVTPLVSKLNTNGIKVDFLVRKEMIEILKNNENIDKMLVFEDLNKLYLTIKGRYQYAILINPINKDFSYILKKAAIKERLTYVPTKLFPRFMLDFTNLVRIADHKNNKAIQNASFLSFFKLDSNLVPENDPLIMRLKQNEVNMAIKKYNLKGKYIVISTGSRSQKKMNISFPSNQKFANIIDYLYTKYKITSILIGSKEDKQNSENIIKLIKNKRSVRNFSGLTSIRELAVVIKKATLLIGVDSGSIHIAASQSTKVLDLMRKSQSRIWYPWMNKDKYVVLTSQDENLDLINESELIRGAESLLK